jgi:hypothetical protein
MALVERLATTPQRKPTGIPCSVGALLDRLPPDEAAALEQMMGPLGWSGSRIYEALVAEGHEVGRQTIGRHRSRACRCFRSEP